MSRVAVAMDWEISQVVPERVANASSGLPIIWLHDCCRQSWSIKFRIREADPGR